MVRREIPLNLQPRAGLNPTRVRMPPVDAATTVILRQGAERRRAQNPENEIIRETSFFTALEFLQARFPDDAARIAELVSQGEVYDDDGEPITADTEYRPHRHLYLFREPPVDEMPVPELDQIEILHRDKNLLVIDKPHNVSVIPRGRWVTQTALVYLRNLLDLPQLSPVHRLDRPTAGVLVFTVRPAIRGAYQMMFQNRLVQKEYLAVTAAPASGTWLAQPETYPLTVHSRIVKLKGIPAAQEVEGEPNAETEAHLVDKRSGLALWRLVPHTGKTHQLRVHMNSLGLPIIGDPFFTAEVSDLCRTFARLSSTNGIKVRHKAGVHGGNEWNVPLQLLANSLEFVDPVTGEQRRFESRRQLSCWSEHDAG